MWQRGIVRELPKTGVEFLRWRTSKPVDGRKLRVVGIRPPAFLDQCIAPDHGQRVRAHRNPDWPKTAVARLSRQTSKSARDGLLPNEHRPIATGFVWTMSRRNNRQVPFADWPVPVRPFVMSRAPAQFVNPCCLEVVEVGFVPTAPADSPELQQSDCRISKDFDLRKLDCRFGKDWSLAQKVVDHRAPVVVHRDPPVVMRKQLGSGRSLQNRRHHSGSRCCSR